MANSHYSADSAPLPPSRLVFEFRSAVTGASAASVPGRKTATASETFPATPSSLG
jgi:hypothetical protein